MNVGRKHTEESKDKIRKAHLGFRHSDEAKRKMSESRKGRIPWNKGKTATPEARAKMAEAQQRRDPATRNKSACFTKGIVPHNKGKEMPAEVREKLQPAWDRRRGTHDSEEVRRKKSEGLMGYKRSPENCRNIGLGHKGISPSEESRKKMSMARVGRFRGPDSPTWKGGRTPLSLQIRGCFVYRQWRSDIFTRDNFTCQDCGVRGTRLHAHHSPRLFSDIMAEHKIETLEQAEACSELWNVNNGVTLCQACHKARHARAGTQEGNNG